jgi:L-ribulokinase
MQIYADVLEARIRLPETDQSVALGAAILGCIVAGTEATGYASISQVIHAMSRWREDLVYRPDLQNRKKYEMLYPLYRSLADTNGALANAMRQLRTHVAGHSAC